MQIAQWLAKHPKVEKVIYPGLPSHPQHAIAAKQMQLDGKPAFGGMITILLKGGLAESRRFLENVHLFALAESLGGVESLIEHRASIEGPESKTPQGLLRVSVGLEHADDLIDDLAQALERASS